jgi:hypothetical protein
MADLMPSEKRGKALSGLQLGPLLVSLSYFFLFQFVKKV